LRIELEVESNGISIGSEERILVLFKQYLDKEWRESLIRGETPYGVKWPALARETVKQKKRKGFNNRPLQRTGRMFNSIRVDLGPGSIRLHMDAPAAFHQLGNRSLPKRQIGPEDFIPTTWLDELRRIVRVVVGE
jgi:hypothetical protein